MTSWRSFDRWARGQGYTYTMQGTGDEAIQGVGGGVPIATGRHNNPDGVPNRLLQEIAFRLNMTKHDLEEEIG